MSDNKPIIPPAPQSSEAPKKLSELSPVDKKIADIEAKLAQPTEAEKEAATQKRGTSPSICGEPQSIDDYLSAMLGIDTKKK